MSYPSTEAALGLAWERAPEWSGWVAIGLLVVGFALLAWWLFFSPLPQQVRPAPPSADALRARHLLAGLVLLSGIFWLTGARWDELWHRMYGGFGEDFLWPPHLLMYTALGLNAVFAGIGLSIALRGRAGLRERFRTEPLMGLLGLLAAYQLASIPADLLWHEIIGPDISAWSLPHLLLAVTTSGTILTGVAIALSTVPERPWRSLADRPQLMELVALGLLSVSMLNLLQFGTTEWEWVQGSLRADSPLLQRPAWAYPVVALVIGIAHAHLALYATRRIGAASAVAVVVLVVQLATLAVYRVSLPPGPVLASHLLLVAPALALEAWYSARSPRHGRPLIHLAGIVVYAGLFLLLAFPYLGLVLVVPALDALGRLETAVVAVVAALIAGYVFARLGLWLGRLGRATS